VTETQNSARDAKPGPSGTCHNPLKRILEPSPDDSRMDMDGDDNDRYIAGYILVVTSIVL
jgi:hypothetical protein